MLNQRIPQFFTLIQKKVQQKEHKKRVPPERMKLLKWTLTDSNRRPSACKADALNQLS